MPGKHDKPAPSWVRLRLEPLPSATTSFTPDGVVEVTPKAGGQPVRYIIEFKSRLSESGAQQLARYATTRDERLLVLTNRLTKPSRDVLRETGISWMERDTGRIHIQGPGLLIDVVQVGAVGSESRAAKLTRRSGTVAETLLLHYRASEIKVTELANAAGVSTALASRLLNRLDSEEILRTTGSGPHKRRFLEDPYALLDLWAAEDSIQPERTTPIHIWARTKGDLYRRLEAQADSESSWALGGISAANLHAPTLSQLPTPGLWLRSVQSPVEFAEKVGGELVDEGATAVLWQTDGDPALHHSGVYTDLNQANSIPLVSPPRAYVEALAGSGRAPEVAENLRKRLPAIIGGTAAD